ncbi:MAG: ATP-binding cassette domain-containing protein [Chitinophagaceae bacterium]
MELNQQTPSAILATLSDVSVNLGGKSILDKINLTINNGEQWAIIGHSGAGKTTLAHVFTSQIFFRGELEWHLPEGSNTHIELVEQQHHFKNRSNTSNFYYQQRFNASEADDSMTVADVLVNYADAGYWASVLHLDKLMDEPLLQLSNGENKRLQLAKALLAKPALLILDNPFLGLDVDGRKILRELLNKISTTGIHIILITNPAELPDCITHVAVLEKGKLISAQKKEDYLKQPVAEIEQATINTILLQQLQAPEEDNFSLAVDMQHVTIQYGDKIILNNINWQVKKGECWNLSGPNGAGKSTLLSLITADNPQAYANKIVLFDKQRGSGESIWDIKKRIGFVSPELHVYFEQHATCFEVIASGLFDTIGLFRKLSEEQEEKVLLWLQLMNLEDSRNRRIFQLSASQQRMALLARALVKNPPLLILDEPTQGLDEIQTVFFKNLVNEVCKTFNTTLIYVSHYSSDLPSCIQHFIRLDKGKAI